MCHPLVKGPWLPKALGFRYSASTVRLLHAPLASRTEAYQSTFPGWIIYPTGWMRLREAKSCLQPTSKSDPEVGIETQTSQPYCGHWVAPSGGLKRTAESLGKPSCVGAGTDEGNGAGVEVRALQIQQQSRKQLRTHVLPQVYQGHCLRQ